MDYGKVFSEFITGCRFKSAKAAGKGNIHETIFLESLEGKRFVLQKLNSWVFRDLDAIMNNALIIGNHFRKKREEGRLNWKFPEFYCTKSGDYIFYDTENQAWRLMDYIENFPLASESVGMYEVSGSFFGDFIRQLSDLNPDKIRDSIPDFHNLGFRMDNFKASLLSADPVLLKECEREIDFLLERENEHSRLFRLQKEGKLPLRLTHNDTKMENILFDAQGKPAAIIDLDTVMKGIIQADFGDAVRSFGNSLAEDDPDFQGISFRMDLFASYSRGFISSVREIVTEEEAENLVYGPFMWTYMQAVRFLTDYLDGNRYYKIKYPEHNLVRTRNQVQYLKCMEAELEMMNQIIQNELNTGK